MFWLWLYFTIAWLIGGGLYLLMLRCQVPEWALMTHRGMLAAAAWCGIGWPIFLAFFLWIMLAEGRAER
jgi:hypothetical protein